MVVESPDVSELTVVERLALVATVTDVAVLDIVVLETVLDEAEAVLRKYILSLDPAPQYSVALSPQVIVQSVASVGTDPAPGVVPHQHSPPYSTPAHGNFFAAHAAIQAATVLTVLPPAVGSARPAVASK